MLKVLCLFTMIMKWSEVTELSKMKPFPKIKKMPTTMQISVKRNMNQQLLLNSLRSLLMFWNCSKLQPLATGTGLTVQEVRQILTNYVKDNDLKSEVGGFVKLDPLLRDLIPGKSDKASWEELLQCILSKMSPGYSRWCQEIWVWKNLPGNTLFSFWYLYNLVFYLQTDRREKLVVKSVPRLKIIKILTVQLSTVNLLNLL